MFKVTIENLGRNHVSVSKLFPHMPDYSGLLSMARPHLLSSSIDFPVREETDDLIRGTVLVGGWRPVGSFVIERVEENAEAV